MIKLFSYMQIDIVRNSMEVKTIIKKIINDITIYIREIENIKAKHPATSI